MSSKVPDRHAVNGFNEMAQADRTSKEIESKFYVSSLKNIEAILVSMGATGVRKRVCETNIRFDTSDGSLARAGKILRLRKDIENTLTFKGPATIVEGARFRQEIELRVDDFSEAWQLLEAFGYTVTLKYEKFRVIYQLTKSLVMLDELPYGQFVEIESEEASAIHPVADQLGLNWELRIFDSYTDIFVKLKAKYHWNFQDLTFENFETRSFEIEQAGIQMADSGHRSCAG